MEKIIKWKPPHQEDWNQLFKEALRFRKLQGWKFMNNEDIFGIQDPVSGDLLFCSVMGAAEEYYGLAAYFGFEGLHTLNRTSVEDLSQDEEEIYKMHNIICTFEAWQDLLIEEQIQAEKYDLKLKKDPMCPGFISYEPGYIPYSLSQRECQLMTTILQQSITIARNYRDNSQYLTPPKDGQILLRKSTSCNKAGNPIWRNTWIYPPPFVPNFAFMHLDQQEVRKRLTTYPVHEEMQWEVELKHMPFVVEEGFKPYYPRMLFIADHQTGYVLEPLVCGDLDKPESRILNHIVQLLDQYQVRPSSIYVRTSETLNLFSMLCSELGIRLIQTQDLAILDEVEKVILNNYPKHQSNTIH
jgi:hypothetical protein